MVAVSVVMSAYNPGPLLERSLGSVHSQTHTDLEVVVVYDASTEDITSCPGMDDPRVRHIRLSVNRGVGEVLNTGVWEARSEYVAFLAHDDDWMPEKLERQVPALVERPEAPFCYTDFEWVFANGEVKPDRQGQVTYKGLLAHQTVSFCSLLLRRDAYFKIGGLSSSLVWAQDYDFLLRALDGRPLPVHVPEVLTRYYLHGANHSSNYRGSVGYRKMVLRMHRTKALRNGRDDVVAACEAGLERAQELYAFQAFDRARLAYREGRSVRMLSELGEVARTRPSVLIGAAKQKFWP